MCLVEKLKCRVSAEAELADDALMKASVSPAGGDQRVGEGLRHAASVDSALDVGLHLEKPQVTAGEDPCVLQRGRFGARAGCVEYPQQDDWFVAEILVAQQDAAPGCLRAQVGRGGPIGSLVSFLAPGATHIAHQRAIALPGCAVLSRRVEAQPLVGGEDGGDRVE